MKVGIVGLGLIGGSLAKAYKEKGYQVYGQDREASIQEIAQMAGIIDGPLDQEALGQCELIWIALYPRAAVEWLESAASHISPAALVIDACGVKQSVCPPCFALARKYGFTFVGGHPMAGTQFSGLKYSRASLFKGASMVIVPEHTDDILLFERIKTLLAPAEFGRLTLSTAKEHDEMIAFTSQLAHLVSNAYIKSPAAGKHKGFSAGSYKDLTRVAWLNQSMWTELFLENKELLLAELDGLISSLGEYREALEAEDAPRLESLLREGKERKEVLDLNGPRE